MQEKKFLTSKEAAEYLGFSLSYFRKLMMRRAIPMYKPSGKLCFFDIADLDTFRQSVRIASQEEIEREASAYITTRNKRNQSRTNH